MRLSFICPVLNEVRFIWAWVRNVRKFSSDIHVIDCGSEDGTLEILREEGIEPILLPDGAEVSRPYQWDEGRIRNALINQCQGEYIVNLDADELLPDGFKVTLENAPERLFYRLWHRDFWYSPLLVRRRQLKKDYWRRFWPSTQIRVFKNCPEIRYQETGNHAQLLYRGMGRLATRTLSYTLPLSFYHFHHVTFGKDGENRQQEARESGLRLESYWGPWPEEVKLYDWFPKYLIE